MRGVTDPVPQTADPEPRAKRALEAVLRERIAREGPLSLAEVMRVALYDPEHGYYSRLRGFGAEGDYVTSPELHPVFGYLLARPAMDVWAALGQPNPLRLLEIGAGTGALARALLDAVSCDVRYSIDERSRSLRARQQSVLAGYPVSWEAPRLPAHLVIANEVLDAQPVHRVSVRNGELRELLVGPELRWVETEASAELRAYFDRLAVRPPEGGVAEVNLDLAGWVRQTARHMATRPGSLLIVLDYGYPAEDMFAARPQGTLRTYYRHTLGSDPLVRLGEQDISAHVDFTTLASSARAAGLNVLGVTSQRALLRNLGIEGVRRQMRSPADQQALAQLVDPDGLGHIGVLFMARGLPGYQPVGLVGREWPDPQAVPTLDASDDFLVQWREAFALES